MKPVWIPVGIAVVLSFALACSGGVSQSEHDSLKTQVAQEQQKVATLQQQASSKVSEAAQLEKQVASLDAEVKTAQEQLGTLAGVTPLIYTKVQPTPTPRPVPTPPPAGYVPPTPVPPDPDTVGKVFPFTFYIEHLTGHQVTDIVQFPACVPNSQFKRGAHLVWRFEVFDTATGKRVTSLDNPTIKVILPDGKEISARFARRAGTGPWTWVAAWTIPGDYPLGALDYQIVVTSGGRTGTFDQDDVAVVNPDRGVDSRVQILD